MVIIKKRKPLGFITGIIFFVIGAYIALPTPINIFYLIVNKLMELFPLCPGVFCSAEIMLKIFISLIGIYIMIDSAYNDLRFIKEQFNEGNIF